MSSERRIESNSSKGGSPLLDRLVRLPCWPVIEPNLSRWCALAFEQAKPENDVERRLLGVMNGEVDPRDDCPVEDAAAYFGTIASVMRGHRFEIYTDRERWYPEAAFREGIYAPRRGGDWMYFNDVR